MSEIKKSFLFFLVSLILLSEVLASIDVRISFLIYWMMTILFLYIFSHTGELNISGRLASILIIIPMIRIAQIFVNINPFWNTLILYLCFLYLVMFYLLRYEIKPGFTFKRWYLFLFAVVIAGMFGFLANSYLNIEKTYELFYLLPLIAFVEELFFRGMLQNYIDKHYNKTFGIFFVSILYSILSLNQGLPAAVFFFIVSLVSSEFYSRTKNIYISMLFSVVINYFFYIFV